MVKWRRENNSRIERHIYVIVWSYAHNFNAMKVYFEQFNEGVRDGNEETTRRSSGNNASFENTRAFACKIGRPLTAVFC